MRLTKENFYKRLFAAGWLFPAVFLSACSLFIRTSPPLFSWPLKGYRLSQTYAAEWNRSHQGIDLAAPEGSAVFSSHSGRVIYAGSRLSGYGKTVIVEHSPFWATLYAHLKIIHVKKGWKIPRGFLIGAVGRTGNARGAHLHFELIYRKQPVNPLLYLSPRKGR